MLDRMICAIAAAIMTCSAVADLHHDQTDQTNWHYLTNVGLDDVNELVDEGLRLFDLEIEQAEPFRFAVIMKPADGADTVGETDWEFGLSGSEVASWGEDNPTRRIHDIVPHETIFGTRYAFTWINNTGGDIVNGADAGLLLAQWGASSSGCSGDLDGDGDVDGADLGLFLSAWGPCP